MESQPAAAPQTVYKAALDVKYQCKGTLVFFGEGGADGGKILGTADFVSIPPKKELQK